MKIVYVFKILFIITGQLFDRIVAHFSEGPSLSIISDPLIFGSHYP